MKLEPLIDSIKQSIATGVSTPIRIVERTFLLDIVSQNSRIKPQYRSLKDEKGLDLVKAILHNLKDFLIYVSHSPYVNFIILLSAVVMTLLTIAAMISFFLSQVIIPTPNQYVNDRGTLVFKQPLATEHYMFLLNSTELWSDSGIEVIRGDKVVITISGSFYSEVDNLYDSAKKNTLLRYDYFHRNMNSAPDSGSQSIRKYLLDPEKPFGVLLFRIERPGSTSLTLDAVPIVMAERNENTHTVSFEAPTSGILRFAVNDIVLKKDIITPIAEDSVLKHLIPNPEEFMSNFDLYDSQMARKWFDDNCGELLINVKVTRSVTNKPEIPFYDKIFISSMRTLMDLE